MQRRRRDVPLGLYMHIPFCRKRCKFCYFKVFTEKNAGEIETYVSALAAKWNWSAGCRSMGDRPFRFVYFGGGTPSFLSAKQLTSLVDRLRPNVNWDQAEEVTFECEPGTLSEPKLKTLRELGVTRLSLGIENFCDDVLQENGRAHLSAEIYRAWDWIVGRRLSQRQHRSDRRHGRRDVGELAGEHPPDDRTGAGQRHDLPVGTAVQHGLFADILGDQVEISVADWPTKRPGWTTPFENWARRLLTSPVPTRWSRIRAGELQLSRQSLEGSDLLATGIASFGHVSGVHYQNLPEWKQYIGRLLEESGCRSAGDASHAAPAADPRDDSAAETRLSGRRLLPPQVRRGHPRRWRDEWQKYVARRDC